MNLPLIFLFFIAQVLAAIHPPKGVDEDVWKMVQSLPLKYKIGQMTQFQIAYFMDAETSTFKSREFAEFMDEYGLGSMFDTPFSTFHTVTGKAGWDLNDWRSVMTEIQNISISHGPKIPLVYGVDTIHGANYVLGATMLPQPIALGATLNTKLAEQYGHVMAKDSRAAGAHWIFSPVLGVAPHPQWPRHFETMGEDTHITLVMGSAKIKGIQGWPRDLAANDRAAACMKHFLGYPVPGGGQDRGPSVIPERFLQEYFLPPFQAAVDAGAATTMESYNEINGEPVISSRKFLRDILRDQLGFDGVLISDYNEVNNLVEWHRISPNRSAAVELVMRETSLDMSMVPLDVSFMVLLKDLVESGHVSESRVDESCARVMQLKKELGLFESPLPHNDEELIASVGSEKDKLFSLNVARESVTLLKNAGDILPLENIKSKRIMVTGAAAQSIALLSGGWSIHWQGGHEGDFIDGATVLDSMQKVVKSKSASINHVPSCDFETACTPDRYSKAVTAAKHADYAVVVVGEKTYTEKVGNIFESDIAPDHHEMAMAIINTGIPVILVLVEGRPRLLKGLADRAAAVIHAYLPGPYGGEAISDIVFGNVNPSGRLPFTYPKYSALSDIKYWHRNSETDSYLVEFEFGTGLSYTTFEYSEIVLSTDMVTPMDTVTISLNVTNTGQRAGKHSVVAYLNQNFRSITPESKRVVRFDKVDLEAGESSTVTFELSSYDFSFIGRENTRVIENGNFTVFVGDKKATITMEQSELYHHHAKIHSQTLASPDTESGDAIGVSTLFLMLAMIIFVLRSIGPGSFKYTYSQKL